MISSEIVSDVVTDVVFLCMLLPSTNSVVPPYRILVGVVCVTCLKRSFPSGVTYYFDGTPLVGIEIVCAP